MILTSTSTTETNAVNSMRKVFASQSLWRSYFTLYAFPSNRWDEAQQNLQEGGLEALAVNKFTRLSGKTKGAERGQSSRCLLVKAVEERRFRPEIFDITPEKKEELFETRTWSLRR